jgi:hypothetical protein
MGMTKFTGATDDGYVKVQNQLWLWVGMIQKQNKKKEVSADSKERDSKEPDSIEPDMKEPEARQVANGPINSGGGPVFLGSQNAGRDININSGQQRSTQP